MGVIILLVPVRHPFHHVSGHIKDPIGASILFKSPHRGRITGTVRIPFKIGHISPFIISPGPLSLVSSLSSLFPLGLYGEPLPLPMAIGYSIIPGDSDNWTEGVHQSWQVSRTYTH